MKFNLGVAPTKEQHPCIGFRAYESRTEKLMERWRSALYKKFPQMMVFGTLNFDSTPNKRYGKELHLSYFPTNYAAQGFVEWMMENLPEKWADCDVPVTMAVPEPFITAEQGKRSIYDEIKLHDFGIRGAGGIEPVYPAMTHFAKAIKASDAMHNHLTIGKYLRKP